MRLQTQSPLRMLHAILRRQHSIEDLVRPIHRLQEKVIEAQPANSSGIASGCGNTSFSSLPLF